MPRKKEGTKTIKLSIYFWTDVGKKNKAEGVQLEKKTCWDSGFVRAVSNNLHGIRSGINKNFNNFDEIPAAIKDAAKSSGIKMYPSKDDKRIKDAIKVINEAKL